MAHRHVDTQAIFAIERFAAYLAFIDKLPREMNRLQMIFNICFILICLATAPAYEESSLGILFYVLLQY